MQVVSNEQLEKTGDGDVAEPHLRGHQDEVKEMHKDPKKGGGGRCPEVKDAKEGKMMTKSPSRQTNCHSTKLGGRCGVSSAATTEVGLGSGTFARPPSLAQNRREVWLLRKIRNQRVVKDR